MQEETVHIHRNRNSSLRVVLILLIPVFVFIAALSFLWLDNIIGLTMVKQLLIPFLGVIIFIALTGYYYKNSDKVNSRFNLSTKQNTEASKTVAIGNDVIKVEIADNDEARRMGLSNRSNLDTDSGMLFIFDTENVSPIFWMKDTLIPIDIIWINDGAITKINANVQPPDKDVKDSDLVRYGPDSPIDYVLEVNGGYAGSHGISVGNKVDLSKI